MPDPTAIVDRLLAIPGVTEIRITATSVRVVRLGHAGLWIGPTASAALGQALAAYSSLVVEEVAPGKLGAVEEL